MFALRSILVSAVIFLPASAYGACVQSDLTGTWRFEFNSGADVSGRTRMMSCVRVVRANGLFNAVNCKTIFATDDTGSVSIHTARPLKVSEACEVTLGGQVASSFDISIEIGSAGFHANGFRMTLNRSKDVMLGYASVNNIGNVSVMAVKRD